MELYKNQVPGGQVWALLVVARGTYDTHTHVRWYITAEASSEEYRDVVDFQKRNHGGTVQRWKVTLPRQRMTTEEVTDFVDDALLYQPPGITTQLLDVSVQQER